MTITITSRDTITVDPLRPDKYCATGWGAGMQCQHFQLHIIQRMFGLYSKERPYCKAHREYLTPDGANILRHMQCTQNHGDDIRPGLLPRVEVRDSNERIPDPEQLGPGKIVEQIDQIVPIRRVSNGSASAWLGRNRQ